MIYKSTLQIAIYYCSVRRLVYHSSEKYNGFGVVRRVVVLHVIDQVAAVKKEMIFALGHVTFLSPLTLLLWSHFPTEFI